MALGRVHARRIGFVLVVIAGIWFELSLWGGRVSDAVLEVQRLALDRWAPRMSDATGDGTPEGAEAREPSTPRGESAGRRSGSTPVQPPPTLRGEPALRPLSPVVVMCLVVIGALVWWESRLPGWAIGSSLAALTALLAVSTMMLAHAVMVPTAGAGMAIVLAALGRRVLEAAVASRDRRRTGD